MLWMLYDDKRLPASARRLINGELPVYYSTVSFWEIALKRGGKGFDFAIEDDWDILLPRALKQSDVLRLDLEAFDCRRMERLPLYHRDPFDRMLVAQAVTLRYHLARSRSRSLRHSARVVNHFFSSWPSDHQRLRKMIFCRYTGKKFPFQSCRYLLPFA